MSTKMSATGSPMVTVRSASEANTRVILEVLHLRPGDRPDAPPLAQRSTVDPPDDFVLDDANLAAGRAVGLLGAQDGPTSDEADWVHSTSWRVDGRSVVLTFLAFGADEERTAGWSALEPVDPAAPPDRSEGLTLSSVLHHAMRHLAFLALRDPSLEARIVAHGLERVLLAAPAPAGLIPEPMPGP
jgi:hypothetical protein